MMGWFDANNYYYYTEMGTLGSNISEDLLCLCGGDPIVE